VSERPSWTDVRKRRLQKPTAQAAYADAGLAYELGRQVRTLREARGLSQRELAGLMGTTQSAIARLEAGGSRPSISTLERLAGALGLSLKVTFSQRRRGDACVAL
jgi:ribosome-binding protein aMBF1 (putative translation factor)